MGLPDEGVPCCHDSEDIGDLMDVVSRCLGWVDARDPLHALQIASIGPDDPLTVVDGGEDTLDLGDASDPCLSECIDDGIRAVSLVLLKAYEVRVLALLGELVWDDGLCLI